MIQKGGNAMEAVGIIPARYGSSRLPGKPLMDINGKPMIQHVYERAKKAENLQKIWVATDSMEILRVCEKQQIPVILTKDTHRCAAHRLGEAAEQIKADQRGRTFDILGKYCCGSTGKISRRGRVRHQHHYAGDQSPRGSGFFQYQSSL